MCAFARFADALDKALYVVGLLAASISGACWPAFAIFFGEMMSGGHTFFL
jgi:hypothetical protein